jgi:hypothetical protein
VTTLFVLIAGMGIMKLIDFVFDALKAGAFSVDTPRTPVIEQPPAPLPRCRALRSRRGRDAGVIQPPVKGVPV